MAKEGYCNYFVSRKKRYCRMTVREGKLYCGEHEPNMISMNVIQEDPSHEKRIKCPLDPTHTCFQSKLTKHLSVCNAKRLLDAQPLYIVKNINLDNGVDKVPKHTPLSKLDNVTVDAVITKINVAYEKLPIFLEKILQHEVVKDALDDTKAAKKHLSQNASLLAHLEQAGLVQNDTCYVEFGAGKGKLTYWLAQIMKSTKGSCIVLVDRSSHRHKSDNKLKNEDCPFEVIRIRADIADLQLNKVSEIGKYKHKVGIAKHLCGTATDLTIRCLVNAMQSEPRASVSGLVVAFCCHHTCDFKSYAGKEYLRESGFTDDEFPILCSIASWATCGSHLYQATATKCDPNDCEDSRIHDPQERLIIGRKVKSLLNWGRVEFLRNAGFDSQLFYYTSTDVSLENMCIVATRKVA